MESIKKHNDFKADIQEIAYKNKDIQAVTIDYSSNIIYIMFNPNADKITSGLNRKVLELTEIYNLEFNVIYE